MLTLFRRLLRPFQVRLAAEAEADLRGWHASCDETLQACIQALADVRLPRGEIGVVLDRIDRTLFRLRDAGSGAERFLRGRSPQARRRMRRISERIVEVRNETARFLIRAQGPRPSFLGGPAGPEGGAGSYERALAEVGQPARLKALDLQRELRQLWADLQPVLLDLARGDGTR